MSLRITTWNTKQGVAPRQKAPRLWEWIISATKAELLVLTEAKVPKEGLPAGWTAIFVPGGQEPKRNWGTIIAGCGVNLQPSEFKRRLTKEVVSRPHAATTFAVDVLRDGKFVVRVVGAYGLLHGSGSGRGELKRILNECDDIIREHGSERLVVAGDLNLWPDDVIGTFERRGLISVTSRRSTFPPLDQPESGSRIWTHKNGPRASNGIRQELDFIFVSKDLVKGLSNIMGGVGDYPDAWDISDHAPVATTLDV